ncbi:hypothetical protein BH23PLA1_BH23PLA1_35220 [soil metagenome]
MRLGPGLGVRGRVCLEGTIGGICRSQIAYWKDNRLFLDRRMKCPGYDSGPILMEPMVSGPMVSGPMISGHSVPMPLAPLPICSCENRRGLARWRWHKANCKRHLQEKFIGFPEEFQERPLGAALYEQGNTMVGNYNASRMVFYQYDFQDESNELNLAGLDKLRRMARTLPMNPYPVIVERTPLTPGLDLARRLTVLGALDQGPFPVPPERVLIGPPISRGLIGVEAAIIFENQILQTIAGGYAAGGGAPAGAVSVGSITAPPALP